MRKVMIETEEQKGTCKQKKTNKYNAGEEEYFRILYYLPIASIEEDP